MSRPKLVQVWRPIDPESRVLLCKGVSEAAQQDFPDIHVKWRKLGETGVTYVRRYEYERLIGAPNGKLADITAGQLASNLNEQAIPRMPHGQADRLPFTISRVAFLDEGSRVSISYLFGGRSIHQERMDFVTQLNAMNRTPVQWDTLVPRLNIATIPTDQASDQVLEMFLANTPPLELLPAVAVTT